MKSRLLKYFFITLASLTFSASPSFSNIFGDIKHGFEKAGKKIKHGFEKAGKEIKKNGRKVC